MVMIPRFVYFDCDTGVDDAVALGYLLGSPEITLVGIGTVSGNIDAATAARNTLSLLQLADRQDVPVAVGSHDPLVGAFNGGATHVHGGNGIGDVVLPEPAASVESESAADMIIRLSHDYEHTLEILAVGPLTNLALALQRDPSLPSRVRSVTLMGGAAMVPGNVTALAEANIANDPEAAAAVLAAPWPVTVVPLDVTMEHVFEEHHREALARDGGPIAAAIAASLDFYFDFYTGIYGRRASALHDPLAAALLVGSAVATVAPAVPTIVDTTDGPGRGQLIADLRGQRRGPVDVPGANVRVVLEVPEPIADELVLRICSLPGPRGDRSAS